MKICFYLFAILLFVLPLQGETEEFFLHTRPQKSADFLAKFRSSAREYRNPVDCSISREGLDQLRISGSNQFSEKGFEAIAQAIGAKDLLVVDLRREFHGLIDGQPMSWRLKGITQGPQHKYNLGRTAEEIEREEEVLLQMLVTEELTQYKTDHGFVNLLVQRTSSERQLVESLGFHYLRFPITDWERPTDEEVDRFIKLVNTLSKEYWLHFHCSFGEGRTTTFMCIVDMMRNSHHLSADEIMHRQEALGGASLYDFDRHRLTAPAHADAGLERLEFLYNFHAYCVANPDFAESWSSWIK